MDNKSTLENKLKKYTALASGITVIAGAANAQVLHTDLNPDVILTGQGAFYLMDLNADGTDDFTFVTADTTVTGTTSGLSYTLDVKAGVVYPGSGNSWMANSSDTTVANVPNGSSIGPSDFNGLGTSGSYLGMMLDISIPMISYSLTYPGGNFLGSDGFVGLKFDISGSTHYGWARVEMSSTGNTLTIKEYAYESTAGTGILAGANGVGINEVSSLIEIRNVNNEILILTTETLNNAEATITSISGKQISKQSINNQVEKINLNEVSSGIYFVNVRTDAGITTKKVYVR